VKKYSSHGDDAASMNHFRQILSGILPEADGSPASKVQMASVVDRDDRKQRQRYAIRQIRVRTRQFLRTKAVPSAHFRRDAGGCQQSAQPSVDRHDCFSQAAWQGLQVDEIVVNHECQPFT